jgi:apolipoprotein N-acyltransferase
LIDVFRKNDFDKLRHMKLPRVGSLLPSWKDLLLAIFSALLLTLAFPDFDYWFLAWVALVPLLWAIDRERDSAPRAFICGWMFGIVFLFSTCWWLTFAPITYAGFPWWLAYLLLLVVTIAVGLFPAVFAGVLAMLLRRFGSWAFLLAAFFWTSVEFLRYWITGNNWNSIGYSQAFGGRLNALAAFGGVALVSFAVVLISSTALLVLLNFRSRTWLLAAPIMMISIAVFLSGTGSTRDHRNEGHMIVAVQPNVPMSGLNYEKWRQLRARHVELAERALAERPLDRPLPTTVIFPESPMNFAYEEDEEFREFVHRFAKEHDVSVLFNAAEPDPETKKYFNSAVLVGTEGRELAQYDKVYLLPFGESVPGPLQAVVPAFVGSFSYGKEYDLLPVGEARAGVMICFESHFGELSRRYVLDGADVLIEMTNDGYLGPTPVLRQHLANAVFRAIETNRPVLRVTNVGITAYITEGGEVIDPSGSFVEDTRVWHVGRSDGSQTVYVRFGNWFEWFCTLVTLVFIGLSFRRRPEVS